MTAKAPYKGCRHKNRYGGPLSNDDNDDRYFFLHNLVEKLSHETFTALKHTATAILQITNYCIDELQMAYILPWKFQTDQLELRFGKYRQFAGDNYNISVRQVLKYRKEKIVNVVCTEDALSKSKF